MTIAPTPPAGVITLDPTTRTVTIDTIDPTFAGTNYVATVRLLTPEGVDSGIGFDFNINLYDVCDLATLTPSPASPSPVDYTLTDNLVVPSPTFISSEPTCQIEYTYSTDLATIQTAITFVNDPANPSFTIVSSDFNLIGTYQVTVTGITGSASLSTASVTFTLNVLNPCLDSTFFSVNEPTLAD